MAVKNSGTDAHKVSAEPVVDLEGQNQTNNDQEVQAKAHTTW